MQANYALLAKIGPGPLDPEKVKKCQEIIDNNQLDFAPIAEQLLERLKTITDQLTANDINKQNTQEINAIVMELKANASTFKYSLAGNLANIMLNFLESLTTVDQDAIDIVTAHQKTLSAIISKRMTGDGGEYGQKLEAELKSACKRYFDRTKKQ